jgi:hypothetical protein
LTTAVPNCPVAPVTKIMVVLLCLYFDRYYPVASTWGLNVQLMRSPTGRAVFGTA